MSGEDHFLDRWSRRKAVARQKAEGENEASEAEAAGRVGNTAPAEPVPSLPDIESLGPDSDFSAFMRAGVPEALRRQALRRLWQLDPAFSKLDGLLEYGEDYNAASKRAGMVRTAWRIGRGMAGPEPEEAGEGDGAGPEAEGAAPERKPGSGGESA